MSDDAKERPEEELADLIQRAMKLGFSIIDLYHEGDELIAFTCSTSRDYIDAIQNIELKGKGGERKSRGLAV